MNIKKIFGTLIALCAVLCITLAWPVNAVAGELESIPLVAPTEYKIASGSTTPCETPWENYNQNGIYLDIDTSGAGFTETPLYFTSLGGNGNHWTTMGATSIYKPSPKGFRVYIYKNGDLTPDYANDRCWYINWMAIGK
ncbi:hypothetical protein [Okeania sp. SIO2B3]|uniref:hypothetical protein n=1 Tax=Okeania sp. SIO2B3 TaxID=2607784 RepID=UPI0013BED646|nr:hypothetical protein [Okeania sp. SIO2B3]NET42125.1 hypothetical protein [Okeania sp. SIO2B3]